MKNNAKKILIFAAILVLTITFLPIHSYASWKQDYGDWRYEENGNWVTDWKKIGGKWYYFDENGYMLHYGGGLYFVKGMPYYFDSGVRCVPDGPGMCRETARYGTMPNRILRTRESC